eukprot:6475036-Amphidinium_carterae.1
MEPELSGDKMPSNPQPRAKTHQHHKHPFSTSYSGGQTAITQTCSKFSCRPCKKTVFMQDDMPNVLSWCTLFGSTFTTGTVVLQAAAVAAVPTEIDLSLAVAAKLGSLHW